MENIENQQDFTGSTEQVLIKSEQPSIQPKKRGRPRKEPEPQLSDFETAFVNSYLDPACGYDSRAAVIKAGHSEKGSKDLGLKLMADIRILRAIELGRKKLAVSIATSRTDMLRKIEAFLSIAMEKKDPTGAARLLSLEIGMLGYNEPVKMDITGSINLSFGSGEPIIVGSKNPERFSDAEDVEDIEETFDDDPEK